MVLSRIRTPSYAGVTIRSLSSLLLPILYRGTLVKTIGKTSSTKILRNDSQSPAVFLQRWRQMSTLIGQRLVIAVATTLGARPEHQLTIGTIKRRVARCLCRKSLFYDPRPILKSSILSIKSPRLHGATRTDPFFAI